MVRFAAGGRGCRLSEGNPAFVPSTPLFAGGASNRCRASIVIPARNEETTLARCLGAFCQQLDARGQPLPPETFEILLLLNNCTDGSAMVAHRWRENHPDISLSIAERTLPPQQANVGSARRMLMDTAWQRLPRVSHLPAAILCTDADTVVAPDWLAHNLRALEAGADVVGGRVSLLPEDLEALPSTVRHRYREDRRYAALVAQLEDFLDPQPGDRWPRHLDHFGASLTCTPNAYAAAGGMPALLSLEDEAFVDRVRRANLRLRHDPAVRVYTSARLTGRTPRGMARQLQLWNDLPCDDAHTVPSAAFLAHRFQRMQELRRIFATGIVGDFLLPTDWWRETFRRALHEETTCPGFLAAVYCGILIAESFDGPPEEPIANAIRKLDALVGTLQAEAAKSAVEPISVAERPTRATKQLHDATASRNSVATESPSLQ